MISWLTDAKLFIEIFVPIPEPLAKRHLTKFGLILRFLQEAHLIETSIKTILLSTLEATSTS